MMTALRFESVEALEAANPRRSWRKRWPVAFKPKSAYVYLVIASRGRVKIGASTHPSGRVKFVAAYFGGVQDILIVGPTKTWRQIENLLVDIFSGFNMKGANCHQSGREWFRLSAALCDHLRDCFLAGCSDDALNLLYRRVTWPELDYQI